MTSCFVSARAPGFWDNIADNPLGSLFSSPLWAEAFEWTYGFETSASTFRHNDKLEALLFSYIHFSYIHDVNGERIVSVPFADFCDPLTGDAQGWRSLIDPLPRPRRYHAGGGRGILWHVFLTASPTVAHALVPRWMLSTTAS